MLNKNRIIYGLEIIIDTYLLLMYNTCNTPATPLNNAHPGGFFLFTKRFKYEIYQTPYNISRTG